MRRDHVPVLLAETLTYLNLAKSGRYLDGTLGGGGHTEAILAKIVPQGKILALDRDPAAVRAVAVALSVDYEQQLFLRVGSYEQADEELDQLGWPSVDGILLDLGLSSIQLAESGRGFSFQEDGILDLRFDPTRGQPAYQLLNHWKVDRLTAILRDWGEFHAAHRLAEQILRAHRVSSILTTQQLIAASGFSHPRRKAQLFQAFRIATNDELGCLERALPKLWKRLAPSGRLVIISFQSLEDRLVKQTFRRWSDDGIGHLLTKKPVRASPEEITVNPRSRSAKLRAIEKINTDLNKNRKQTRGKPC